MTNDEALTLLETKRNAVNAAMNGLIQYISESDNWKTAVATAKMTQVKEDSLIVGADLSAWDGSSAD